MRVIEPRRELKVEDVSTELRRWKFSFRMKEGASSNIQAEYERLVTSIQLASPRKPFSLAVMSSISGEGTTTVCINLVQLMAGVLDENIVLLDANMHASRMTALVGEERDSQRLLQDQGAQLTLKETNWPNLSVATPEGVIDCSRLLRSNFVKLTLDELKRTFAYVIVDAPAILENPGSIYLASIVDASALVVRAGVTPIDLVKKALSAVKDFNTLGVILNAVR